MFIIAIMGILMITFPLFSSNNVWTSLLKMQESGYKFEVLEILKNFNAKATFFCVGNNVKKYKDTFELIKKEGHSVGNHTFNHEKGWRTKTKDYVNSVIEANALIQSPLFRPPHGRIKFSQIKSRKKNLSNSATQ